MGKKVDKNNEVQGEWYGDFAEIKPPCCVETSARDIQDPTRMHRLCSLKTCFAPPMDDERNH
jgi:hypothetical protein